MNVPITHWSSTLDLIWCWKSNFLLTGYMKILNNECWPLPLFCWVYLILISCSPLRVLCHCIMLLMLFNLIFCIPSHLIIRYIIVHYFFSFCGMFQRFLIILIKYTSVNKNTKETTLGNQIERHKSYIFHNIFAFLDLQLTRHNKKYQVFREWQNMMKARKKSTYNPVLLLTESQKVQNNDMMTLSVV